MKISIICHVEKFGHAGVFEHIKLKSRENINIAAAIWHHARDYVGLGLDLIQNNLGRMYIYHNKIMRNYSRIVKLSVTVSLHVLCVEGFVKHMEYRISR